MISTISSTQGDIALVQVRETVSGSNPSYVLVHGASYDELTLNGTGMRFSLPEEAVLGIRPPDWVSTC